MRENLEDALVRLFTHYLGPHMYREVCVGFGGLLGWAAEHCEIQRPVGMLGVECEERVLVIDGVRFCKIHQEGRFGRVRLEWLVDRRARW